MDLLGLLDGPCPEAALLVEEDATGGAREEREVGVRVESVILDSALALGTGRKVSERREKRQLGVFFAGDTGAEAGAAIVGVGDSSSTWMRRTWI